MSKRLTKEEFISKAIKVHGNQYDYSKVDYISSHTKVCIICPIHGEFLQTPNDHLNKRGCRQCGIIKTHNEQRKNIESFILEANRVHNYKYDYSLVDYKSAKDKIKIICPTHGVFLQSPDSHLREHGCPRCKSDDRKKLVYGVGINDYQSSVSNDHIYKIWTYMLARCNSDEVKQKHPTYKDCTVCEEWIYYSNFKKWFYSQKYKVGYHLDKDILIQGNKVYSPQTCAFVPPYINALLVYQTNKESGLKRGVSKEKNQNKYRASCNIYNKNEHLGSFDTEDKAHEAYKKAKYDEIRRVAQEALNKGDIDEKVYNALLNYKINEY